MAYRQHVPFGRVLDVPRTSVRPYESKRSFLLAFLKKPSPAFRNHRLDAGICEIIKTAANDLFPRETQELARADIGLQVVAIVVGEQNGRGRMVYNRPEQQIEFFRAVFREPAGHLWPRGHNALLLRPAYGVSAGAMFPKSHFLR